MLHGYFKIKCKRKPFLESSLKIKKFRAFVEYCGSEIVFCKSEVDFSLKHFFINEFVYTYEKIYIKIPFLSIDLVLGPTFFSLHRLKQDGGGNSASTQRFLHCNSTLAEYWPFSAKDGLLRTISSSGVTGWIRWSGEVWGTSCSCGE